MSARHDVRKNFRLTAWEAERLAAHAAEAEVTESQYVRALIRDPGHVFTADGDTLRSLLRETKRIGVNVNQIAHFANAGKLRAADLSALEGIRDSLDRTAEAVLDALEGGGNVPHR